MAAATIGGSVHSWSCACTSEKKKKEKKTNKKKKKFSQILWFGQQMASFG
jgi:hypothetical protein